MVLKLYIAYACTTKLYSTRLMYKANAKPWHPANQWRGHAAV